MKPGSKGWRKFMIRIRAYSRIIYAVSIGAFILDWGLSYYMIVFSGFLLGFNNFLAGFQPIHEEPNWELVYPELALGHSDEKK